jgi:hypothetical protein
MRRAAFAACLALALAGVSVFAEKQERPLLFYHEEKGVKELEELKALFDFDEYVAAGKTEFERMELLKRWTYDTVTYGGAKKYMQLRNGLTILKKAVKGEVFWCNNIGAVYMQCALSMGWTSRYVFLRNTKGESHIANDIWSNQYQKWVMMDPTWNIHIEKDGLPLSLIEIRDEWRRNDGADLVYVYGAGDNERRYSKAQLPIKRDDNFLYRLWPVTVEWISFMYEMAIVGRNNFFSVGDGSGEHIWDLIYTIKDQYNSKDEVWEFRRYPSPPLENLFHPLNRVAIALRPIQGVKGRYELSLDAFSGGSYAPNFESYEYRLDEGEWRDSRDGKILLETGPGRHRLSARVRNRFGARGAESTAELEVKDDFWSFLFFWRRFREG